jgi:hypothetical protein
MLPGSSRSAIWQRTLPMETLPTRMTGSRLHDANVSSPGKEMAHYKSHPIPRIYSLEMMMSCGM